MQRVVFVVDYRRNYLTLCLVTLAGWYVRLGWNVKLLSLLPPELGVDAYWDQRVVRSSSRGSTAAVARADLVLWWTGSPRAAAYLQDKWLVKQWEDSRHYIAFHAGAAEDFSALFALLSSVSEVKFLVLQSRVGEYDKTRDGLSPHSDITMLSPVDFSVPSCARTTKLGGDGSKPKLRMLLRGNTRVLHYACGYLLQGYMLEWFSRSFDIQLVTLGALPRDARSHLRGLQLPICQLGYLAELREAACQSDVFIFFDSQLDDALAAYTLQSSGTAVYASQLGVHNYCLAVRSLPLNIMDFLERELQPAAYAQNRQQEHEKMKQGQVKVYEALRGLQS